MHGLVNKAIQSFVVQSYGDDCWQRIMRLSGAEFNDFETMLLYEDELTTTILSQLALDLEKEQGDILEDIGTHLVSHPKLEGLRRLLRFGGDTYVEFLHSLNELPDRARLAVADLTLPSIELREHGAGQFTLLCGAGLPGFGHVLCGILRTMADDYGALVMLDHEGRRDGEEVVSIRLIQTAFAQGRSFELGGAAT